MQRLSTTVVTVVGGTGDLLERITGAANVRILPTDPDRSAIDRAVDAWSQALRTAVPYSLHDADPLAAVADAWVRWFDQLAPVGELEVAVAETLARWRARSLDLPDYYLAVDPEAWSPTRRHWYLGYLAGWAPMRVVATNGDLLAPIGHLATGRWWPDLDQLLTGIERIVPDQAGLAGRPGGGAEPGGGADSDRASGQLVHLPGHL
jgi:hypothetical protein